MPSSRRKKRAERAAKRRGKTRERQQGQTEKRRPGNPPQRVELAGEGEAARPRRARKKSSSSWLASSCSTPPVTATRWLSQGLASNCAWLTTAPERGSVVAYTSW